MSDTNTAAPMRLRAEPPRVTRLSRKVLAGVGAAALLGAGEDDAWSGEGLDKIMGGEADPPLGRRQADLGPHRP